METIQITTLEELEAFGVTLLNSITAQGTATVFALSGDLGAGKTAFVKKIGSALGVREEITSPTFVIMKSYATHGDIPFDTLVHIDAYRIESDGEMRVLGFSELLNNPANLICIEWPEKIRSLIPPDAVTIAITSNMDGTRTITYGKN